MEMSWLDSKMVLCGPYVGSIEEEILSFRPFVHWLKKVFQFKNFIISTHYNRTFLYSDSVIPIFKQYTKNEISQVGHKHEKINSTDYIYLTNDIKDQIVKITDFNKSDIIVYNLGYSSLPKIVFSQKIFKPIKDPPLNKTNTVLFIPENSKPKKEIQEIYRFIKDLYDIKIVGDMKTLLKKENILLNDLNYYDIAFEYIVDSILEAKAVITPCSHWTALCNLHGVPVFSWSKNVTKYKSVYNFGNTKSYIIPYNREDINILFKSIKNFIGRL